MHPYIYAYRTAQQSEQSTALSGRTVEVSAGETTRSRFPLRCNPGGRTALRSERTRQPGQNNRNHSKTKTKNSFYVVIAIDFGIRKTQLCYQKQFQYVILNEINCEIAKNNIFIQILNQ